MMKIIRKMKRRIYAAFALMLILISSGTSYVNAASTGYFTSLVSGWNVVIKNDNGTKYMEGMAVGNTYLYTAKVSANNHKAILHKVHIKNKKVIRLYDRSYGSSSFFSGLGHANDMEVIGLGSGASRASHLFIVTNYSEKEYKDSPGLRSMVRLTVKASSNQADRVGSYFIKRKQGGKWVTFYPSGVAIYKENKDSIDMLFKSGNRLYKGTVDKTPPGELITKTIYVESVGKLLHRNVEIHGTEYDFPTNLSTKSKNWHYQGMEYHNGIIYMPMSKQGNKRSVILAYRFDGKKDEYKPIKNVFFDYTSKYAFEIESCGINSSGKMFINTNRKTDATIVRRDGIHIISGFCDK